MPNGPLTLSGPAAALAEAPHLLRCEHCDVTWRGSSVPCWCCGAPGAVTSEVRLVPD